VNVKDEVKDNIVERMVRDIHPNMYACTSMVRDIHPHMYTCTSMVRDIHPNMYTCTSNKPVVNSY